MTTTRRQTFGIAAGFIGIAAQSETSLAQVEAQTVRLTLSQLPWRSEDRAEKLIQYLESMNAVGDGQSASLVVLPPCAPPSRAQNAAELYKQLGVVARTAKTFLAGAAVVRDGAVSRTEGFLIGPDAKLHIRMPKITPDVWAGFSDTTAAQSKPSAFPVAALPFGKVAILVGEDLYRPSHVRALCFNGAEIVLNIASERADAGFPTRREAVTAIAYSNMLYIGGVTGPAPSRTGIWDWQGNTSLAEDASTVSELINIESLRVARQQGTISPIYASRVLPPMVRDAVYAEAFKTNATKVELSEPAQTRSAWTAEAQKRIAAQAKRVTPESQLVAAYDAILVQTPHRIIANAPDRKAAIVQNIKDFLAMAEPYARRPLSKLVMFGEFTFTAAGYRTIKDALSVTLSWPGPELELIAAFAAQHRVYVAAQQLELDPKFPGRIFNTAFLFDDQGRLASRHRKLQCVDMMGTLPDTTPGSIYTQFVDAYGQNSLFQVVDTPLGKLAPMICFENMFPEIAQIYAQNGAEVYLHLTSEGWDPITETRYAWNGNRRLHALAGSAYFLSVNQGDDPVLRDPYHVVGECQAIDPYGRVIGMLRESRPGVLVARVDLNLLRTARSDVRANLAIWDDPRVYMNAYAQGHAVPNDVWAKVPASEFPYGDLAVYKEVTARFNQRGIFTLPQSKNLPTR